MRVKIEHVGSQLITEWVIDLVEDGDVFLDSLVITIFACLRNGMGAKQLKLRPSGLANNALSKTALRPSPIPKKSLSGAATAGSVAPSRSILEAQRAHRAGALMYRWSSSRFGEGCRGHLYRRA